MTKQNTKGVSGLITLDASPCGRCRLKLTRHLYDANFQSEGVLFSLVVMSCIVVVVGGSFCSCLFLFLANCDVD